MLDLRPMSRTALALVLVAASTSSALAGGYVGLGIGTGAASSGDFALEENGRSGRLMVGYRFGRFAVEGLGMRYGMTTSDGHEWTGTTLAVAAKYSLPLQDNFEVFARAGLQRTDVNGNQYTAEQVGGGGFLVGGGAEFKLPVAAVQMALFVDYTVMHTSLDTWNAMDLGLTSRIWSLGATLSF